jgi:class 3 adenylate cyclase/tetratricopeptide (TPR) repeat protein
MKCPRCQHDNPQGARFCEECATPLARTCANCGTALSGAAKFCHACAHPVAAVAGAPSRSPDSYTPKHLAERILTSKAALEGERKQITVLFADLKGSMELLADRDPEEVRKILDPILERMIEAVHRYEGTVNQVMGDGIMALFGAPLAHEDHAVRACYAALLMQEAIGRYAEDALRLHGVPVQIRIGLNSGEVVVRFIGSDLRMDYTAVGQTTHLAARMEQIAKPGSILLSGETVRLAEGYVQVKQVGPVPVKGFERPIEVYELTGTGPTRTRFETRAAWGLTPFVGRQTEFELLDRVLESAEAGHGQVLALVGEPGVGKSRLVWEFAHSHRATGWRLLESGAVSYEKPMPYRPIIDLLKTYLQIEDRDGAQSIDEKLTAKILALDRALEATMPALRALLDVPVEHPEWQALDPPRRRQRTLEACEHLVLRESQAKPLLLVFEDLQWIDTETQAFLDDLVESLPTARLVLVVTYRPEYVLRWAGVTYCIQLRVNPLPSPTAAELLAALLGPDPSLKSLKPLLIERTQGNPLFLEESVRALLEGGVVVGVRGACRLATPAERIQVPKTVQAILAARIDRLPPPEKLLLQAAAVIGGDIPLTLLQAIIDVPGETLREGLSHLQTAEFLYETSMFPDPEYTFKHPLTHEVAYGSLLQGQRCALHARIVEAIERLYSHRLPEQYERLAHHASRGEIWDKAFGYLRQAGNRAAARSAYNEAIAFFEQALAALGHFSESRQTIEQAIDIRFDLRTAFQGIGKFFQNVDLLRKAEALASALNDQWRLGRVSCYRSVSLFLTGDYDEAIESARRALAIAEQLGDSSIRIVARQYLGMTYHMLGQYQTAAKLLSESINALRGDLRFETLGQTALPSVQSRTWLGHGMAELGEFAEGIATAEEGLRIAEELAQPYSHALACFGVGVTHLLRGEYSRAIGALERGLKFCEDLNFVNWLPRIATYLGTAYARSQRIDDALPLLERAVEVSASTRTAWAHSLSLINLSAGWLLADRLENADRMARLAFDQARRRRERGLEAWSLRLLAEIASRRDPSDADLAAEHHYHRARTLAEQLGMRPLVAHCHLGFGKLYRRTDRREQAQEHLAAATTMYREMGMTYWLEKAEAQAN